MNPTNKQKWYLDTTLKYLFRMARAITNYSNLHTTPCGSINKEGRINITRLMQLRYSSELFWLGNVTQVLRYVTSKQRRSQLQKKQHSIFDKAMIAAEEEGFISSEEFAKRMTT